METEGQIFIKQRLIDKFNTMEPFNDDVDKIPSLPKIDKEEYDTIIVPNLIRCGAIPKKDLIIGETYIGDCRNTNEATWNGEKFIYKRYKFGSTYEDSINHFEDDDGYDLFVSIKIKNK